MAKCPWCGGLKEPGKRRIWFVVLRLRGGHKEGFDGGVSTRVPGSEMLE